LKKKQERNAKWADELKKHREARRKLAGEKKAEWLKRGKTHWENFVAAETETINKTRAAKENNQIYVPAQPKVYLVIRTKGINAVAPKEKKILQLFRLRQIHNAVFVRVNLATTNLLRKIEPYISYG
jgi:large subunit ribosomal protein L7e